MHYFREMPTQGILSSVTTYNIIISSLIHHKKIDEADEIYKEMRQKGVVPDIQTYCILLHIHARYGDTEKIIELISRMEDVGVKSTEAVYNILIFAFYKEHPRKALEYFEEMKTKGMKPDAYTFGYLIDMYVKTDNLEQCEKILEEMKIQKIKPLLTVYLSLIMHCGAQNNTIRAESLFQEALECKIPLRIQLFETIIEAYARNRQFSKAFHYFKAIQEHKLEPNIGAAQKLIRYVDDGNPLMFGYRNHSDPLTDSEILSVLQLEHVQENPRRKQSKNTNSHVE